MTEKNECSKVTLDVKTIVAIVVGLAGAGIGGGAVGRNSGNNEQDDRFRNLENKVVRLEVTMPLELSSVREALARVESQNNKIFIKLEELSQNKSGRNK